jgi:hypothetical protein
VRAHLGACCSPAYRSWQLLRCCLCTPSWHMVAVGMVASSSMLQLIVLVALQHLQGVLE